MSGTSYIASQDSALLRRALAAYSGGTCLEIGAGNGGNLLALSKSFGLTIGTDLAEPEMEDWKGSADFVMADAAACLKSCSLDVVAFNPPYLAESRIDSAVDGGEDLAVPKRFLRDALRVVKPDGKVVFILNQDARLEEFEGICGQNGFAIRPLLTRRLFFEELTVYEASSRVGEKDGEGGCRVADCGPGFLSELP